jgi:hypothetical protein
MKSVVTSLPISCAKPLQGLFYAIKKVLLSGLEKYIKSSYCSITRSGWHLPQRGLP